MLKYVIKSIIILLLTTIFCYIFMKSLVLSTKIEYRKIRLSYIAKPLMDNYTILQVKEAGKFFLDSLISVWERKEVVFEFKEEPSEEKIKNITLFLSTNFLDYNWEGPFIRRQDYITKIYIDKIVILLSIMFGLGSLVAYYFERKIHED